MGSQTAIIKEHVYNALTSALEVALMG